MAQRTPTIVGVPRRPALLGGGVVVLVAMIAATALTVRPGGTDTQTILEADITAPRALTRAGALASRVVVPAFRDGQYHYVHIREYARDNAAASGDWRLEREQEMWSGTDGSGRSLEVKAAAPTAAATGAGTTYVDGKAVSVANVAKARIVSDRQWRDGVRADTSGEAVWDGGRAIDVGRGPQTWWAAPDELALAEWGVTLDEVLALPQGSGDKLDAAVAQLIAAAAGRTPGFTVAGRLPGEQEQVLREYEVEAAVTLLGSAPLRGSARQAIYNWLAAVDGAKLDRSRTDREDRRGTAVTFSNTSKRTVAGKTLRQRWTQTIIIDPTSARLLEASWERTEDLPGGGTAGSGRARVWLAQDRTASTTPRQDFCRTHELACS